MTALSRHRFWLKLTAALLFAVVAYGGAYAVLVRPLPATRTFVPYCAIGWDPEIRFARYYLPGSGNRLPPVSQKFFAPAHTVDRKLRRAFWDLSDD